MSKFLCSENSLIRVKYVKTTLFIKRREYYSIRFILNVVLEFKICFIIMSYFWQNFQFYPYCLSLLVNEIQLYSVILRGKTENLNVSQ